MDLANRALEINDYIIKHRRWLHRHPELSFHEYETTRYIVDQLKELGIPVLTFDDYTGCIAEIKGPQEGKTVLLRADIDALPIQEETGLDFASVNPGVMHACGHDCHTAMLLGAAKLLWESRDRLGGTVKLLFQAAEEAFIGSHYYWDKGYLRGIDAAFGVHVWPSIPSGTMAIQDGYLMAGCDNFKLTVHGKATHGSSPQLGSDAIVAASAIICAMQTLVSRFNDPQHPLVVTVGTIDAGSQYNVIADTAVMEGTIRSYYNDTRESFFQHLPQIVENTAAVYGCTAELEYTSAHPAVYNNDHDLDELARASAVKLYGGQVLHNSPRATAGEDFSYIMEKISSALFIFLGCYDQEKGCVYPIHNGKFRINEDILHMGAAQYAQFAADYLEKRMGGAVK